MLTFISRYAMGRDNHKLMRRRMQLLADRIEESVGAFCYRVFTDTAPVMEVELAGRAGLGWRGVRYTGLGMSGGLGTWRQGLATRQVPTPWSTRSKLVSRTHLN